MGNAAQQSVVILSVPAALTLTSLPQALCYTPQTIMDGEDSDLEAFEANLSTIIQSRALVSVLFSPEHFRP